MTEEFKSFLKERLGKDTRAYIPLDVLRFIVYIEQQGRGRTRVHEVSCGNLGRHEREGGQECDCPVSLAHGYMRKMVGWIKEMFGKEGMVGRWKGTEGKENPADAKEVDDMHEIFSGNSRISGNFVATKINPEIRANPLRKYFGICRGVGGRCKKLQLILFPSASFFLSTSTILDVYFTGTRYVFEYETEGLWFEVPVYSLG